MLLTLKAGDGMNLFSRLRGGIVLRWVLAQLVIAAVVFFTGLGSWESFALIILVNAAGTCLLLDYVKRQKGDALKLDEHPMDPSLQIANETLPFMRRGLNEETAQKTAEIIKKISEVAAVAITDREKVLAYIGECWIITRPGGLLLPIRLCRP